MDSPKILASLLFFILINYKVYLADIMLFLMFLLELLISK